MPKVIDLRLIATNERRGSGKEDSPVRLVEQWFTLAGQLVLEYDPHLDQSSMTIFMIEHLRTLAVEPSTNMS